jgi:hypothetical protein
MCKRCELGSGLGNAEHFPSALANLAQSEGGASPDGLAHLQFWNGLKW